MESQWINGKIKNCQWIPQNRNQWEETLKLFNDREITIIVKHKHVPVKHWRRKFLHGIVIKEVSDQTGYETEEIWEMIKQAFLSDPLNPKNVKSTTDFSDFEFGELTNKVIRWFQDKGFEFSSDVVKPDYSDFQIPEI